MENASKALIMAASILLGVMIISVGVTLFNIFSEYSENAQKKMAATKDSQFNDNFLRYVSYLSDDMTDEELESKRVLITAHDIVTIANCAKENNTNYGFYDADSGYTLDDRDSDATNYVRIDVENSKKERYNYFENKSDSDKIKFMEDNSIIQTMDLATGKMVAKTKYYECVVENIRISADTNRIKYMKITPIN